MRHYIGENNTDAYLKRTIMRRERVDAISEGRLDFGPWEQIYYGEYDGWRKKSTLVKVLGK